MNKGITLITLIITCIVIMILVGATTIVGFDIVEKAEQQETNKQLAAVGNAVLEQYTKYIKTKDTTYLIGTKYKKTDSYIQETINKVGIELVQIPSNYAEDLTSYYQLSTLQLKQMGIEDSKYTYIVNYLTGEVINQTKALAGEKYYMYSRSYFDGNITDVQEVVGDKIRIAITPTTWTSTNVTVYLSYVGEIPTGYVIQYKKGNETWTTGNKLTVEKNNTTVYARLYKSDSNDEMGITSKTITNIDKTAPTAPTNIETTATTNSITVQASGGTDVGSGVAGYQYSIDNIHWTKTIEDGTNYIFSGLQLGTNYTIYVRTVDNVGTISINKTKTINELGIPIEILNDMDINLLTPEQKTINGHYLLRGNINIKDTSESKNGILTTLKDKILEIDNKSICSLNGGTYNGDIQLNEEASLNINEGANINGNILMQESSNLTVNSGTISKNIEGGNITITNGNINGNIVNAENLSINAGYYTGEIIDCKNIKITGGYFRNWPPDPVQGYFVIPSDNSGDYPYMVVKEEDQRCSVD